MLTAEQIENIQAHSVESQRQTYSDERLWSRLLELNQRQNELVQLIAFTYELGFSWRNDFRLWQRRWNTVLSELNTNQPLIDLIIWHLTRRGDSAISDWQKTDEQGKRELEARALRVARSFKNE